MEMEESKPRFLPWFLTHLGGKRAAKGRNAIGSIFHNRSMKRVSSKFRPPVRAITGKKKKKVAWVSLQGLLVDAEEATSSKVIKGELRREEAAAWELFTPLQRVIIVAVVAAASLHNRNQIEKLNRQLEMKDKMLSMLRRKLESLTHKEVLSQGELIDSIKKPQNGIDTLKDKASSRHRVVTFGVSPSTTSEADRGLDKRQTVAEGELYKQEQEEATQQASADAALYAAQQAADAELYKKLKEAEGIKAIADSLTKAIGDNKIAYMCFRDYMMIQQGMTPPQSEHFNRWWWKEECSRKEDI